MASVGVLSDSLFSSPFAHESNNLLVYSIVDFVPFAADPLSVAVVLGSTDSGFKLFMLLIIVLLWGVTDWSVAVVGKDF